MTGPHCAIRRAGPGDAPALAALRLAFRAEVAEPAEDADGFLARCERWMGERLTAGGAWHAWLAEAAGRPLGTVWLQLIEKLPNPVAEPEQHGYVSSLYVVPDARGSGLGSRLLGVCLEECTRRELDAVLLWPTARSRSLYLRHGFEVRDDMLARRAWAGTH